jgi:hypothetical protein
VPVASPPPRSARLPQGDCPWLGKSQSYGILRAVKTITIKPTDDRYSVREALLRVDHDRVLVILPWDVDIGWSQPFDFEIQRRVAQERNFETAWVIEDPDRRSVARLAGLPVFASERAVEAYLVRHDRLPPLKAGSRPEQPKLPWWASMPRRPKSLDHKSSTHKNPPLWLLLIEGVLLIAVLGVVGAAFALGVPSAKITLYPASVSFTRIVPISVDPTLEAIDTTRGVITSQRVGEEFEGYAEVVTSGRGQSYSGRASGRVLFSNLLGQDYPVPAGTVVRTSAGSYPVRYQTTQAVTVPAFGQVETRVEAMIEGPRGNVDAYQINFVEGVIGIAIRVTNTAPITGAQSDTVRVVAEADRERAWALAAQQIMANAHNGLQEIAALRPGRFLPQQSLRVQAAPRTVYTHSVGEQTDILGLSLRLLITGETVTAREAQAVAYGHLVSQLPPNYTLIGAQFGYGEAAEEDIGPGQFSFFVTAYGQASARIDAEEVQALIRGMRVEAAHDELQRALPLARPPTISVSPSWFPYVPFLPIRTQIEIVPERLSP